MPKAGTPFITTVARYACRDAAAALEIPAYGDAKPTCLDEKTDKRYGSSCAYKGREVIDALLLPVSASTRVEGAAASTRVGRRRRFAGSRGARATSRWRTAARI